MNAAPTSLQTEVDGQYLTRVMQSRRRRRRTLVTGVVVVLAVAGIGFALINPFHYGAKTKTTKPTMPTGLATVTLGTLTARTSVSGTLSYAGSYQAVNQATGPYTMLPSTGQVIKQGKVLYTVNGKPVAFLRGSSTPMYRDLKEKMTGPDVKELNSALIAAGYASSDYLSESSSTYNWATADGVKQLQKYMGVKQDGKLLKDQVVFIGAAAIRITEVPAQLGTPAAPGAVVLKGSSTSREVNVDVDASLQPRLHTGEKVTITLPTMKTTDGTVSWVGTVAKKSASGGPTTIPLAIKPSNPEVTGSLDQAPVSVSITTQSVDNALMVPVNALLALLGGGYGVEVVDAGTGAHHILPVELGLFDDTAGTVQISGNGLAAGQRVLVPTS